MEQAVRLKAVDTKSGAVISPINIGFKPIVQMRRIRAA
jgi:hypothetical protein